MTLKKIAIFPNSEYDPEYSYTKQAVRVLAESGIRSILSSPAKPFFPNDALSVEFFNCADDMMEAADAILVLGGDGTMIGYSVRAAEKNKPSIGVNLGHLGFLMALERTEIEKLSLLAEGKFTVESRMLLDAQILLDGKMLHSQRILNDIVVASGVRSKIAEFSLSCKPLGLPRGRHYRRYAYGLDRVFLLGGRPRHRSDCKYFFRHARVPSLLTEPRDPSLSGNHSHRIRKNEGHRHGHSRHHGWKKFTFDSQGCGNTYQKIRIHRQDHQNRR